MAKVHRFQGPIDLQKYELRNARLQNLFNLPPDPFEGQVIYKSDIKLGAFYNGTEWLFFGLLLDQILAIMGANNPDETNPFATLDDIPIVPEDLIDLADTPNAYTGQGGKAVAVKMSEDGVEFILIIGVPAGGGAGQVLGKLSSDDYDIGWVDQTGGGGGGGAYLTDLPTWPVLIFDKNYRYVHEMVGPIEISSELLSPLGLLGNFNKIYIKSDGVNIPTFTDEFEVVWNSWANVDGSWNRLLAELTPEGKILLQIEQVHIGTPSSGTGAVVIELFFDDNYIIQHVVSGTVELTVNNTGAEIGYRTLLYIQADGVNKPFWSSDIVVTYDDYINEAGVWNRFWIEWRPENKALSHIINL